MEADGMLFWQLVLTLEAWETLKKAIEFFDHSLYQYDFLVEYSMEVGSSTKGYAG